MTDRTPSESIAAGLACNSGGDLQGAERRARRIAADFRPNPLYDRLIVLRDADSPHWGDLAHSTRLAVAMYDSQRQIAAEHGGVDTTPPPTA